MNYHNPETVPHNWNVGDVILDLYEVRPVTEGFGAASKQRGYHQGGFGRVYKVWHFGWNREMAVKVAREEAFTTPAQKEAFTRECETWVDLGLHMHIAACHYVRDLGGVPRVFSEYAPAGTLQDWISSGRLYEGTEQEVLARILDVSIQFAWGLHYAHEMGVIHQDVKPLNALMWNDLTLKVSDFGLAQARAQASTEAAVDNNHTKLASSCAFTPAYCSPEQKAGEVLGRSTDIWSWAVSVMQLFTKTVFWESGTVASHALEYAADNYNLEDKCPRMPDAIVSLLKCCFASDPSKRPSDLLDCIKEIKTLPDAPLRTVYKEAKDADTHNNKGISYCDLKASEKAKQSFQCALKADKQHVAAKYNLLLLKWREGEITDEEALNDIKNFDVEAGDTSAKKLAEGLLHFEGKDFKKSSDALFIDDLERNEFASTFKENHRIFLSIDSKNRHINIDSSAYVTQAIVLPGTFHCVILANLNGSRVIQRWDLNEAKCLYSMPVNDNATISTLTISRGEEHALVVSRQVSQKEGEAVVYDLQTGERLCQYGCLVGKLESVSFNSVGDFIDAGIDGFLKYPLEYPFLFWNVLSEISPLLLFKEQHGLKIAELRPQQQLINESLEWYQLNLRSDIVEFIPIATLRGFRKKLDQSLIYISPHGNNINVIPFSEKGGSFSVMSGHTSPISQIGITGNEKYAITSACQLNLSEASSYDNSVRIWDLENRRCLKTIRDHPKDGSIIAISPDNLFFLTIGADSVMHIYSTNSLNSSSPGATWLYSEPKSYTTVANKTQEIIEAIEKSRSLFYDGNSAAALEMLEYAQAINDGHANEDILKLKFDIGKTLLVNRCKAVYHRYDLEIGLPDRTLLFPPSISSVDWIDDNRFIATNSHEREFRAYNVNTRKGSIIFNGHKDRVLVARTASGGRHVFSASNDFKIKKWDVSTSREIATFSDGQAECITTMALSRDCEYLLESSVTSRPIYPFDQKRHVFRLWELKSNTLLRQIYEHSEPICDNGLALSPNGLFALSAGCDNIVFLHRLDKEVKPIILDTASYWVNAVCFSPDGKIAAWASDNAIKLWDMVDQRITRVFEGHSKIVKCISFQSSAKYLLSGSRDQSIKLWDIATGVCVKTLQTPGVDVISLAFAPSSRYAVCGGENGVVSLFEFDWDYALSIETKTKRASGSICEHS